MTPGCRFSIVSLPREGEKGREVAGNGARWDMQRKPRQAQKPAGRESSIRFHLANSCIFLLAAPFLPLPSCLSLWERWPALAGRRGRAQNPLSHGLRRASSPKGRAKPECQPNWSLINSCLSPWESRDCRKAYSNASSTCFRVEYAWPASGMKVELTVTALPLRTNWA